MTTRVLALSNAVGNRQVWGITLPVFVMVGALLIVGYVLEQTTTGRAWYAVGFDAAVARLAGLRTKMLQFSAFLISGLISGLAGIILAATGGAADPTAGALHPLGRCRRSAHAQYRRGRAVAGGRARVGAERVPGRRAHHCASHHESVAIVSAFARGPCYAERATRKFTALPGFQWVSG